MQFQLYLLNVDELKDDYLKEKALSFMDSFRKGKLQKYKTEKDRLHQIATGLLLQAGLLELEIPERQLSHISEEKVYLCGIGDILDVLRTQNKDSEQAYTFPIEAVYDIGEHGKLSWNKLFLEKFPLKKKFPHFSISHSGQYAALVISDEEIGLDIQEPRKTKRVEGGYTGFSRLEAYVKCTGEGYARGASGYREFQGDVPGFAFCKVEAIEEYAIYLCSRMN